MSTLGQDLRLFTLDEAQRVLPLVRSIVRGILEDYAQLQQRSVELREKKREATTTIGRSARLAATTLSTEIEELTGRVNEALAELNALGVEFKGYEQGLVDFPARRNEEIIYLCWKVDEERIAYWHTLEGGYAGRRGREVPLRRGGTPWLPRPPPARGTRRGGRNEPPRDASRSAGGTAPT